MRLAAIQRSRLLVAMVDIVCERGAGSVTVAHVVARSGVSRRTFYEIFSDREDCLLAAFDHALEQACGYVLTAYAEPGRWRERIRVSLTALLEFLDDEPAMGRLLVVESLGAGTAVMARRSSVLAHLIAAIDAGRLDALAGSQVTLLTAESVVGGVLAVIHARLLEEPSVPLVGLLNTLMGTIVLPYLGLAAARRELSKTVPERSNSAPVRTDPLRDLPIRLTYRTVQVLRSIAASPGSSNRALGVAAGITDQGQISKLLTRLQRLDLIHNQGLEPGKGAPNAWTLTTTGLQIERAMSTGPNETKHPMSAGPNERSVR